jgi:hypothetical protein
MIKFFTKSAALAILVSGSLSVSAQTPSDAIMMKKREACFALIYERGSFDQYWEGATLRSNATIETVTRVNVMPMLALGILDQLNFYVAVPYIKTESSEPNGGQLQGAKGFQDLTLALKYRVVNREVAKGKLALFVASGFSTPVSNYLSDYRPYSLGNGTNEFSLRGIVQQKWNMGLYVKVLGGHLFRGQTQIERDFYYNNGAYYTDWMDVPSAWEYNGAVGFWLLDNSLRIEASYYKMQSTEGDDIRKYNGAQPTNKVIFDLVGGAVQYFSKQVKGLGALAYYNQTLNGRNVGKVSGFGVGLTYQFKY